MANKTKQNLIGKTDVIIMDDESLRIGSVLRKADYMWTAWQAGTSGLHIFGKQWHGALYLMTLSNNFEFVVESGSISRMQCRARVR